MKGVKGGCGFEVGLIHCLGLLAVGVEALGRFLLLFARGFVGPRLLLLSVHAGAGQFDLCDRVEEELEAAQSKASLANAFGAG